MNESSSLERRYSFNLAQSNPVAESTHVGGNSFSWGSTSPKLGSCSIINNKSAPYLNDDTIAYSRTRRLTKIDPRIAADVQSKGLASRIVKYHENGTRLNRSMSAHNLYSKPGQFPAVTLKKTELPYRATKQELSMIRIPPPDKSSFCGNTISSLLRSSSVIGLQSKQSEDQSRENRPIMHPPPTENDINPTRSVLDVLKEISRKRINSEDLESEETSKKYCSRGGTDFVDTVNYRASVVQPNLLSLSSQRYKRQRDCITPHQGTQLSETKTSPEQAKKRICNYNNDITSSLSSSLKCKGKPALKKLNQTVPPNLEHNETHLLKGQHYNHLRNNSISKVDIRFENLENNLSHVDVNNSINSIPGPFAGLTQNNNSEVISQQYVSDAKIAERPMHTTNKPRLTLFNKNCDDIKSLETTESCALVAKTTDELNELHDCAGIPFVKPKKITSKSGLKNPIMERTQKSKLALMLSGLRGELFQNSDIDELDSSYKKEKIEIVKEVITNNPNDVVPPIKTINKMSTLATITSTCNVEPLVNANTALSSQLSSNISANKTSSPLVGLKLQKSKSSSENMPIMLDPDTKKSTELQSKPFSSFLGDFSICSANSINTSVANSCSNSNKDSTTTTTQVSVVPNSNSNINIGIAQPLTSLTSDEKSSTLPSNFKPSTKNDVVQYPTVSNASILSTNNINNINNTSFSTANKGFNFNPNVDKPANKSHISTPAVANFPYNATEKTNSVCNFNIPSTTLPTTNTSSAPMVFSCPMTSTNTSTSVALQKINPEDYKSIATSANSMTNKPLFNFNANNKALTSEATTVSSSGGIFSLSSNIDANLIPNSNATISKSVYSIGKTQPTNNVFAGNTAANSGDYSGGDQSKEEVSKQTIDNNAFGSNKSTLFDSQCLDKKSTEGSDSMFGNVTKCSDSNIFSTSGTTTIFGSNSTKAKTQIFGSSANNKLAAAVTPTIFGSTNLNKPTTTVGGFSFGSAAANNVESGTFGCKSSVQTSISNTVGTEGSGSLFGNATKSSESNILTPSGATSIFGSSSTKAKTQMFGSSANNNNKLAAAVTPTILGSTNLNNASNIAGGFSFSAVSNSAENGAFGSNSSGQISTANTSGTSSLVSQNSFTFGVSSNNLNNSSNIFGAAINKQNENKSSGGFSFGSAVPTKTATFTFGTVKNSENDVKSTNNTQTGFSFGAATAIKPNEVSTNKPFSFSSSQPLQQNQPETTNIGNSFNIFGVSGTKTAQQPTPFNFNSGNPTSLQSNDPATNNIFSASPSIVATVPGDRPKRRATRRLQK